MGPHILFRFHKNVDVCAQNIALLRAMNPGLPIHGLYGGFGGLQALPEDFAALFDTLYALPFEDPAYNWQHGDLCLRWWFKDFGHAQEFSHLYVAEWDMLYLHPLAQVYGDLQPDANYVSISNTYNGHIADKWPWIQGFYKWQVDGLLEQLTEQGMPVAIEELSFGAMGGCVICRKFFERYVERPVYSYSNDEVRLVLYSRAFGIPVLDNGFYSDKKSLINASVEAEKNGYQIEDIRRILSAGGRIIHPIRSVIDGLAEVICTE